jgi:hypothetical protein
VEKDSSPKTPPKPETVKVEPVVPEPVPKKDKELETFKATLNRKPRPTGLPNPKEALDVCLWNSNELQPAIDSIRNDQNATALQAGSDALDTIACSVHGGHLEEQLAIMRLNSFRSKIQGFTTPEAGSRDEIATNQVCTILEKATDQYSRSGEIITCLIDAMRKAACGWGTNVDSEVNCVKSAIDELPRKA